MRTFRATAIVAAAIIATTLVAAVPPAVGLNADPFPVTLGRTLAIGDTRSVHVTLDSSLPPGPWDASIMLGSGLTERTVEATITFPDEGTTAPVETQETGSTSRWLPFAVVGVVALLAVCGIAAFVVVRRRRRRRAAMRWPAPSGARHGHTAPVSATSTM